MRRLMIFTAIIIAAIALAAFVLGQGLARGLHPADAATVRDTSAVPTSTQYDQLVEHAYAVARPSVVYVENVGSDTGSGVIYDSTGDIVTNAHVVSGATSLRVTLSTGKTYTAHLVGTDTADDLAVIRINAGNLPAAHFAGTAQPAVAQTVLAIGSPLGYQESVTSGLVSALGRTVQEGNGAYLPNAIQTSAPINPGNSGGALVTLDGTVVGIPTLQASNPQSGSAALGIGFAVPSTRVVYIANQLIASGKVQHTGRAYLGVALGSAQTQSPFGFGGGTQSVTGAPIATVASGGPAGRAGLHAGDVITSANGTHITSADDLLTVLAHLKPGATMNLTVDRSGRTLHLAVHLSELKAS